MTVPRSILLLGITAVDLIKSISPVWDQTIVLPQSSIGELTIFARRRGDMWMLAVMRAGPAQTIQLPLSFLGEGTYNASLVRDNLENDATVVLVHKTVWPGASLTIQLHSGGGFLGRFVKQ